MPDLSGQTPSDDHHWEWDESSIGLWYQFCTRCLQYRDDVVPNEYHGWLPCKTTPASTPSPANEEQTP